jgi:hypothetical protein
VSELSLWLDARDSGVKIEVPACHKPFLQAGPVQPDGGLVLEVRDGPPPCVAGWQALVQHVKTWALYRDDVGRYAFVAPEICPPRRHILVDAGFHRGQVIGEFGGGRNGGLGSYPLENVEIKLYANWLANYGDLILHAVGMDLDGVGYCFVGSSGSGKSTLASALEGKGTTLLGDDQVILRFLEAQFWIYGTPWHRDPRRCSPNRAPLKKLFFLDRHGRQGVYPCTPLDGVTRLMRTAFVPYYRPETLALIVERLALLSEQVPFYTLGYRLGSDVLQLVREV